MKKSYLQAFDQEISIQKGTDALIGIDEAGRGPLAGPVVACACYIPSAVASYFEDVNDSKKLTHKKREEIMQRFNRLGVLYGIGFASAKEIDRLNILQATFLAMRRACIKFLSIPNAFALIDGPYPAKELTLKQMPVVDGDAKSLSIAAASIITKETRDKYMSVLDKLYPGYGFDGHKGYGTAQHLAALRQKGPCPQHRRSFGPVQKLCKPVLFP